MIRARRFHAGFQLLRHLVVIALKRRFAGIHVEGLDYLLAIPLNQPVIICANHHNWWDGFIAVYLASLCPKRKLFLAQEEKHLARSSFFRFAGAFGISLESPSASLPGIRHALELLTLPDCLLWIFPEGRLTSPLESYQIRAGTQLLAEKSGAAVVPVYVRIAWRDESWPSALITVGSEIKSMAIAETFETMRSSSETFADPLIPLTGEPRLHGRRSLNRAWEKVTRQKIHP